MANFEFNPIASYISLRFTCPKCGCECETDAMCPPSPDWSAETHHESVNSEDYDCCCECGEDYTVTLHCGFWGGDGEIDNVESVEVIEEFEEENFEPDNNVFSYYDIHIEDTMKAVTAIDGLPAEVKEILYRTLYANLIACMESYLSDKLIQAVLQDTNSKRKFVETFKDYNDVKFSVSEIFAKYENIDRYIKATLKDIIYHNLPKVKGIYKDALNIDLGNISELMKCINLRHHIVHRNGKDKDGNLVPVTKDDIEELAEKLTAFIENIEQQFSSKVVDDLLFELDLSSETVELNTK